MVYFAHLLAKTGLLAPIHYTIDSVMESKIGGNLKNLQTIYILNALPKKESYKHLSSLDILQNKN